MWEISGKLHQPLAFHLILNISKIKELKKEESPYHLKRESRKELTEGIVNKLLNGFLK